MTKVIISVEGQAIEGVIEEEPTKEGGRYKIKGADGKTYKRSANAIKVIEGTRKEEPKEDFKPEKVGKQVFENVTTFGANIDRSNSSVGVAAVVANEGQTNKAFKIPKGANLRVTVEVI